MAGRSLGGAPRCAGASYDGAQLMPYPANFDYRGLSSPAQTLVAAISTVIACTPSLTRSFQLSARLARATRIRVRHFELQDPALARHYVYCS